MADNFSFTEGSGKTGAADEIGGVLYPRVKIAQGADGSATDVSSAAPLQVTLANTGANATAVKVDGSASAQPVTDNGGTLSVDDGAGSLTVDNAALSVTGGGVEASALRVTIASDSTGVLSVDDNGSTLSIDDGGGNLSIDDGGNSITVDGTITASNTTGNIADAASDSGNPVKVGGKYNSTTPTYTDGQRGDLQLSSRGSLRVELTGTGSAQGIANAADNADDVAASATTNKLGVISRNTVFDGSTWDRMPGNSTGGIYAQGAIAHDAADSGNPVKIGAKAETSPKGITLVSDGDRADLYADADGILMVKLNTSGADLVSERVSNTDGSSTAFSNFSAVASTKNYITGYSIFRTDAGTSPIYVDFRDGTAGSILWSVVLPPNGGANLASAMPLFKTSANTALAFDVSAATSTVYISVTGYQSKV